MAIIVILLDTGLRVSELTSLTLKDIRPTEGVLKVSGKGRKESFTKAPEAGRGYYKLRE